MLDNQTARLQVGDQVPITVQQATPLSGDVNTIVNSIELRDTGVILTVTPRVNAGGLVILEIQQEVSNVVRAETVTQSELATPTISQRLVSSTVAVQSGQTIALGGLITDNRNRSRSGVPILSSNSDHRHPVQHQKQQQCPDRAARAAHAARDRQRGTGAGRDR